MARDPFHQPRVLQAPSSLALSPAREGPSMGDIYRYVHIRAKGKRRGQPLEVL